MTPFQTILQASLTAAKWLAICTVVFAVSWLNPYGGWAVANMLTNDEED
jgi:hypothetical protein